MDSLYLSNVIWRVIRIGEGPLGFGEPYFIHKADELHDCGCMCM